MAEVKSRALQDRQAMMKKVAALDAQVIELQRAVRGLQGELAKEPRYFDDPVNDRLRP